MLFCFGGGSIVVDDVILVRRGAGKPKLCIGELIDCARGGGLENQSCVLEN